ncbi:hypothetical protein FEM03_05155 [Phragmitibacter flavus]|uniref:TonB C-terminal domain-containing protein n=1 Tax=Phragmitibacter flavus TaxID=2576071 RepID=A0A5R8KIG6_9BACT|nr:hypothetical protein [Phragmitibacter flavus]TLD72116.1 hypothetical protein FEM03_05155 [Phragmitibacter flavus]
MTETDTRTIGYGVAASVAVHLLLFVSMALWMNSAAFQSRILQPTAPQAEEPAVTLVFADTIETEPEPEAVPTATPPTAPPTERYIRTTQNQDAPNAPEKSDFVSDRNTAAAAMLEATPDGDASMPTTTGIDLQTRELANRDFVDGETKQDSAPSPPPQPPMAVVPPPSPAPTTPQMKSPDAVPPPPTPKTELAKKTDSSMEEMMKELDEKLAANASSENPSLEIRRAAPMTPTQETPPEPSPPTPDTPDSPPVPPPVPKAIPMPEPIANTPNPKENAFQPHTRTAAVKGTISNRGAMDAVNAAATPTGRYMRQVTSAIERKWHLLRKVNQDFVEPGQLRIKFYVNKDGETEDITILHNNANAVLTDFSLTAILKAELPRIPEDLLLILEKERVEIEYDIVIY